jgi:DNA-3-methyladenine glycosylase
VEDKGYKPGLTAGQRIGINYAGEPWVSKPWRFKITEK